MNFTITKIFLLLFLQKVWIQRNLGTDPQWEKKLGLYGIRNEKNADSSSRNSSTGENNTKSSDQSF
jgi:hypothetical protein